MEREEAHVSTRYVASRTGFHPAHVSKMCLDGRIRARRAGKLWEVPLSELQRLLDEKAAREAAPLGAAS